GIDNTEHSTKITYYTPKVGNDMHKVQLGVSYIPNLYDYGQNVIKYNIDGSNHNSISYSPYQDVVKASAEYLGNFRPVNVVASAQLITGGASGANAGNAGLTGSGTALMWNAPTGTNPKGTAQDFTAWGVGAQAMWSGFTVGGSFMDLGRYNTVHG